VFSVVTSKYIKVFSVVYASNCVVFIKQKLMEGQYKTNNTWGTNVPLCVVNVTFLFALFKG
jgi:uncharacterized protein affecting Mg2+/Co2+ transport